MTVHLLGIAGSLRKASLNRLALIALEGLLPDDTSLEIVDLHEVPLYNADVEADGVPPAVQRLKERILTADGLVIACPEYNYGIPGVLKNAIDWASRPAYRSVLAHKPVAMFGVAGSPVGTARAQGQLKQVLLGCLSLVFPHKELTVGSARHKFDEAGGLSDEVTREALRLLGAEFVEFVGRGQ